MKEVKCPKCDSLFKIDASGYADIVKQIRGDEFETELNIRLQEVESKHDMKLELAQQTIASEKDKEILTLRNEIANHAREIEIAKGEALASIKDDLFAKEKLVERLKNEKQAAETETKLAISKATGELEKEILDLQNKLEWLRPKKNSR